jgi:hypothetical protein
MMAACLGQDDIEESESDPKYLSPVRENGQVAEQTLEG